MATSRQQNVSGNVVWYKQPLIWVVAVLVLVVIGQNIPPESSIAAPVPVISAPDVVPAPVPAAVAPVPAPITNNNIIVLGDKADVPALLERLPSQAQPDTKPEPTAKVSRQDHCYQLAMEHENRVATWRKMMNAN